MTALYVKTNTGFTEVIAVSENETNLEKKMFKWCEERNITPEYNNGDYMFSKTTGTGLGNMVGWLIFQPVDKI